MVIPVLDLHTKYEMSPMRILVPPGVILFLSGAIRKRKASCHLATDESLMIFFF
jgi:hypothetical protein